MQDINQSICENLNNFHMAGIIPVSGHDVDNSPMPWHRALTQIGENLLAVERSVLECNYAGCETIWIICNEDIQPLIKHRIGDYVTCFESLASSRYVPFPKTRVEQVPIFYVPIPPRQRDKRDSLAWTILHGANAAFVTSAKISKWMVPNKYYVSFPYGLYDPAVAKEAKVLYPTQKNVFIDHGGKTIADGTYTGFTFTPQGFKKIRKKMKEDCSGADYSKDLKSRWSSRNFSLDKFYNLTELKSHSKSQSTFCFKCH